MNDISARLRYLRTQMGLPRAEFSLLIGASTTSLFNYERGSRLPTLEVLLRICEQTNVSLKWLLLGTGAMYDYDIHSIWLGKVSSLINKIADIRTLSLNGEQRIAIISLIQEALVLNLNQLLPEEAFPSMDSILTQQCEDEPPVTECTDQEKPKSPKKVSSKNTSVSLTAKGSNNIMVGGNVEGGMHVDIKAPSKIIKFEVKPPAGSIGANALLVEKIKGMFNELGSRREERFGKSAYPVMYNEFKKAFDISKNQNATSYLLWPESRAVEITKYLEEKLNNTIKGRKIRAATNKGHTRPYLLAETRKLHEQLGWSDQEYRARLHYLFNVTSRKDMTLSQLSNYIDYLKAQFDEKY